MFVLKEYIAGEKIPEKEKAFSLREYIETCVFSSLDISFAGGEISKENLKQFENMCLIIKKEIDKFDESQIREENALKRQRKALLGYPKEVTFYKEKVAEFVQALGFSRAWYPPWYKNLSEAVYGEILGFSGISNWLSDKKYAKSVSCKIIGDKVYFKNNGYLELQPQRISKARRELLKRTLLLIQPKEPINKAYHELYTAVDHLRVTIFNSNGITKDDADCIIFRRYIIENLTFEEQAKRGTIPPESIPFIENMCKLGFNVCFNGPVESGKTTFLQSYQLLEDQRLEAVSVETDDETQYDKLMPNAPIMQFCPDAENEDTVLERIKRSDAAYIVVGEARNGRYLSLMVDAANMGTRRLKGTFHGTETIDFAYDVAEKICKDSGGLLLPNMIKVAKSFQYIFQLTSMPGNRGKKVLKGIWSMEYDYENLEIIMTQICKFVPGKRGEDPSWVWTDYISEAAKEIALETNPEAFEVFEAELKSLAERFPNHDNSRFVNPYMEILKSGKGA